MRHQNTANKLRRQQQQGAIQHSSQQTKVRPFFPPSSHNPRRSYPVISMETSSLTIYERSTNSTHSCMKALSARRTHTFHPYMDTCHERPSREYASRHDANIHSVVHWEVGMPWMDSCSFASRVAGRQLQCRDQRLDTVVIGGGYGAVYLFGRMMGEPAQERIPMRAFCTMIISYLQPDPTPHHPRHLLLQPLVAQSQWTRSFQWTWMLTSSMSPPKAKISSWPSLWP
ncbi:hypothetical protein B0H21DRAFT_755070 [Amylocystis lapponica]|nr:hypothetical protein B0H21DRAFT_755070 [Amylocystis lapponica]